MGTLFRWGRRVLLKVNITIIVLVAILWLIYSKEPCQISLKSIGIELSYSGKCVTPDKS